MSPGTRLFFLLSMFLLGCTRYQQAPVESRQNEARTRIASPFPPLALEKKQRRLVHEVRKGETLNSIAQYYDLDPRALARWNQLENLDKIQLGSRLRLSATQPVPLGVDVQPVAPKTVSLQQPRALKLPYSEAAFQQLRAQAMAVDAAASRPLPQTAAAHPTVTAEKAASEPAQPSSWLWPVVGKLLSSFKGSSKGIDIAGIRGTAVRAADAGKVVYAGQHLRGYGKFVIIKHNPIFLSVYAHNEQLLVKEGQTVSRGQKIAEMGDTEADQVKLHFEIRRYGKPVDPLKWLPKSPG